MRFHAAALATGLALLTAYLLFFHFVYGDAFSRFNAINNIADRHPWNLQGLDAYLHRFFVQPMHAFHDLFGIVFLLALAQALIALFKGGRLRLVALYFLAGILFLNFTPTSLATWQPLPLGWEGGRFLMFLTPAAALLAGKLIGGLFAGSMGSHPPPAQLRAAPLFHWLPLKGGAIGHGWAALALRGLAAALLLTLAYQNAREPLHALKADLPRAEKIKRLAAQELAANDRAALVLSTERSHKHFPLYLGFDPALLGRTHVCDPAPILEDGRDAIVYIDKRLSAYLARAYGWPNCNEELLALARARGLETLIDDRSFHLSLQRPPPQQAE